MYVCMYVYVFMCIIELCNHVGQGALGSGAHNERELAIKIERLCAMDLSSCIENRSPIANM
jgi:hypothetical protein